MKHNLVLTSIVLASMACSISAVVGAADMVPRVIQQR